MLTSPLLPPLVGAATSQEADSTVINGQVNLGPTPANLTIQVFVADETTGTSVATGNAFDAAVEYGSVDVQSSQTVAGSVSASTLLEVDPYGDPGYTTSLTTAATGNTGEFSQLGDSALAADASQEVQAGTAISSASWTQHPLGSAGDIVASSQAIANTQGLNAVGGSIDARVQQSNVGTVHANEGGIVQYTPGTATFTALAAGNNVTSNGVTGWTGVDHTLTASQIQEGDTVEAQSYAAVGSGQTIVTSAAASANSVSATNEYGYLDVTTTQDNAALVNADSMIQISLFGTASAVASGVGNSVIAGENGGEVFLDNTQSNRGGVYASASAGGVNGYDLAGSATAMGNTVTGYSCSECGGRMTVRNNQVNSSGVGATTVVRSTEWARSVTGTATAVGNSGSFYVSSPSN